MKRSFGVIIVAVVASMAMAGMALAEDAEETAEREMLTPTVFVDEETGTVYVGLPPTEDDGEDPWKCPPPEEPAEEGGEPAEVPADIDEGDGDDGDEGEAVEPVMYKPGDCIEFVIEHPSGEMHHGAIVSTVAKGLHPSTLKESGYKKGEIMRLVAKTGKLPDLEGLDDDGGDDDDDDGDDGDEPKAEADKPGKGNSENAKTKDKPNKGKKNR